ncbi:transcriptional regulator [Prochlorococcus marinus]|uniref:transcriptional regulator n=1 Tax=Prochlorococcus marinus TaxID=1219 RepID=UPI0022B49354|nr:transcriptional regulator [Prochlorococcus marinus]
MIGNKCLVCGSSNLRADRALSGRLVCNSCGTPFGVGRRVINRKGIYNKFSFNNKYSLFICILILAFILVVI